jgi:hypothetical protein
MADEQDKWLNRETAERLLRGESLEAVDPSARDQAERLSKALGALSAQAAAADGELPGEQAALAAFRKAREAAEAERTARALADGAPGRSAPAADAGLVRIGTPARSGIRARRPRWGRPVRLALAAVTAAGTLGGVAMAAGTGVLPTPFGDDHPRPAASVTAGTSGRPLTSPSPQATPGTGTPGGSPATGGDASGQASGPDAGTGTSAPPASGTPSAPGGRWSGVAAACRDIRDGKELDAGRRRALENQAGGSARVTRYCKVLLAAGDSVSGSGKDGGEDKGGKGQDKGHGKGDQNGSGQSGDDESHPGRGHGRGGHGGRGRHRVAAPEPSAFAPQGHGGRGQSSATPSPSPTYSAL